MAEVKATLTADIVPLKRGLAEATSAVQSFDRTTATVDQHLKKFGNEFSGARIIARASETARKIEEIGGAARLSDGELRKATRTIDEAITKYARLGQEAPASLRSLSQELRQLATEGQKVGAIAAPGGGFSLLQGAVAGFTAGLTAQAIPAIKNMVVSAVQSAGAIADLSAKTGLTTTQVQTLGYAAQQTGASMDTVTGAVSQLSNRLVEGGSGTVGAVRALGLELSSLQALKPGDAFLTIADAIAKVPDPMRQTQLAMELFGKAGAEILPAIKAGMNDTAREAQRLGLVISEDNVQALDDLGDAWDRMALRAKVATASMVAELTKAIRQFSVAPDLSLKSIVQFAPQGSMGGGPFGMLVQEYLRQRMGAPDPVDLATLRAAQRGGDIRLASPTPTAGGAGGGTGGGRGGGRSAASASPELRGLYSVLYESAQDYLKAASVNYQAARGFMTAARVQLQASSDSGIRGSALAAAISGNLAGPGPGVSFMDGAYAGGIPANASRFSNSIAGISVDFAAGLPALRNWQTQMRGVVQAFAQLAQIAGPSLDGVTRGFGTVLASADAANQLTLSLSNTFKGLGDGNGNLSTAGKAVAGGVAGLTTGLQLGGLFTNRTGGALAGAAGGAVSGFMAGGPYGAAAGAVVGGLSGLFSASQNRKAQQQAVEQMRQQTIAAYGTVDDFRQAVERAGFSYDYFLQSFNSSNPQTFTTAVNRLNAALAEQKQRSDALVSSLNRVAKVQGVLSQQQMAQLRTLRPGDSATEAVNAFLEGQTLQAETGILSAVEALSRYQGNVLADFGGSVKAAAAGLAALFGEALRRGESAVQILSRLGGAMNTVGGMFTGNGGQMPPGFAQLQDLASIVSGENTGIAVQTASGLGSALAGFANTGMFAAMPELFGDIASGIGAAWKALENFGAGGQRGLAIFQPYLQTLWELIDANPELKDQLDDQTRALLDFASANGVIGPAFRDSTEKMLTALDRLILKLDEFIGRMGTAAGLTLPTPPRPGGGGTGGDGGGATGGGGNGGEYDIALARGGIVTRPTRALIGEAGPEAVIPLSQLRMGGKPTTQTITVTLDGRVLARSVARGLPNAVAVYGAA